MYIQPTDPKGRDNFFIPKGYSGNAFRVPEPTEEEPQSDPVPDATGEVTLLPENAPAEQDGAPDEAQIPTNGAEKGDTLPLLPAEQAKEEESVPALARGDFQKEKSPLTGGLFSRFPFLSSFLPPPRKGGGAVGRLPEWVVIAAVIFLLAGDDDGDDILPFLLLLLLWD